MKELEEVEIECGPIRVDDCIGKKMTFLHDPDGCRRDCMNKVGREKAYLRQHNMVNVIRIHVQIE